MNWRRSKLSRHARARREVQVGGSFISSVASGVFADGDSCVQPFNNDARAGSCHAHAALRPCLNLRGALHVACDCAGVVFGHSTSD